jgi:GNAT superfamily N-acetyltransferase
LVRRLSRVVRSTPQILSAPVNIGGLVLREATIVDLRPLAELHVRTFNETHVGPFGSGPTYATRNGNGARSSPKQTPFISFSYWRRRPSSLSASSVSFNEGQSTVGRRLNKIYLLREYQRRGLGKRMVAAAVDRLVENGLTSMALFTETDNEPACNFYEQLGGERQLDEQGQFRGDVRLGRSPEAQR